MTMETKDTLDAYYVVFKAQGAMTWSIGGTYETLTVSKGYSTVD